MKLWKCDYCNKRYMRKELRANYGADILLESRCCKPCAEKNEFVWVL